MDYHVDGQHGGDYNRVGLTTESLNEKLRPQYNGTGKQDYDVGFNDGQKLGELYAECCIRRARYNIYVRSFERHRETPAPIAAAFRW